MRRYTSSAGMGITRPDRISSRRRSASAVPCCSSSDSSGVPSNCSDSVIAQKGDPPRDVRGKQVRRLRSTVPPMEIHGASRSSVEVLLPIIRRECGRPGTASSTVVGGIVSADGIRKALGVGNIGLPKETKSDLNPSSF